MTTQNAQLKPRAAASPHITAFDVWMLLSMWPECEECVSHAQHHVCVSMDVYEHVSVCFSVAAQDKSLT